VCQQREHQDQPESAHTPEGDPSRDARHAHHDGHGGGEYRETKESISQEEAERKGRYHAHLGTRVERVHRRIDRHILPER
jgi:hypothetical protein